MAIVMCDGKHIVSEHVKLTDGLSGEDVAV